MLCLWRDFIHLVSSSCWEQILLQNSKIILITPLKKTRISNKTLFILRRIRLWSPWRLGRGTCASAWTSLLAGRKLLTLLSSSGCLDSPSLRASSPLYCRALHARTTWDSHTHVKSTTHHETHTYSHILNGVLAHSQDIKHMWWRLFSVLLYLLSLVNDILLFKSLVSIRFF